MRQGEHYMWNKSSEAKPTSSPNKSANEVSVEAPKSAFVNAPAVVNAAAPTAASAPSGVETSRVGAGLRFRGELSGTSDLYIDGEMNGNVRLDNSLVVVGPNGRVQADIQAREILVHGSLNGNLFASDRIQLGRESRVGGNLSSKHIQIEDGALFKGHVDMDIRKSAAKVEENAAVEHASTNGKGDGAGITIQSGSSEPTALPVITAPAPVSVAPPTSSVPPATLRVARSAGDKAAS
jgi:cytoskeletal protein CcmA (bactofilin family)